MNIHPFLAGLRSSPDFFLQNFNFSNRRALVVRVSESLYREASFLDDRMFTPQMEGFWLPLEDVLRETETLPPLPADCIFHVGHCGSTLISRLLAELPGCLPLREPISLLALALTRRELGSPSAWLNAAYWQRLLETDLRLLARTYRPGERALIKATSTAGNLLEDLVSRTSNSSRFLLMYISLESLLAVMLRTPGLSDSIHAYSPAWMTDFCRLTGRTDVQLSGLGDAEQIVVKWLTLMLLFARAASSAPAQAQLLDFDDFLQGPAEQLHAVAEHFRFSPAAGQIEKLVNGPLMRSYSKIPTQTFNPDQREQELRETRQRFHDEIQAGLRWAEKLCGEIPALDAAAAYLSSGS